MNSSRYPIKAPYRMEVHSDAGRSIILNRIASYENGFKISIEPLPVNRRTSAQNRTYWQWLGLLSDHTGYEPRWLDRHYREKVLTPEIETRFGKDEEIYPSTRELSVGKMCDLMRQVSADCADLGVALPYYDYDDLGEMVA